MSDPITHDDEKTPTASPGRTEANEPAEAAHEATDEAPDRSAPEDSEPPSTSTPARSSSRTR